jgi:hypothetical protein
MEYSPLGPLLVVGIAQGSQNWRNELGGDISFLIVVVIVLIVHRRRSS